MGVFCQSGHLWILFRSKSGSWCVERVSWQFWCPFSNATGQDSIIRVLPCHQDTFRGIKNLNPRKLHFSSEILWQNVQILQITIQVTKVVLFSDREIQPQGLQNYLCQPVINFQKTGYWRILLLVTWDLFGWSLAVLRIWACLTNYHSTLPGQWCHRKGLALDLFCYTNHHRVIFCT